MSDSAQRDEFFDGIAIIGMSGRFPGARNLEEFWGNLRDGVESISFPSDEELIAAGVDPSVRHDPSFVGAGGVLQDIDLFDAAFFGFNPREVEVMDPQQRLFLECAWETLENAGYNSATYPDSIGVYAGTGFSTYFFNIFQNPELVNLLGGHLIMIGNDKDHLTTHVSYKLNLRGPSVAVQTACSTSLVAVCVACRSLLDYQCDMALAGGSSVAVPQGRGYFYREGGIASPDGHCRAFDAKARGTVSGNGVGAVLLKRYVDAVTDGDHIRAVIRGTALNNDGSVKVGYTAPSVDGQAEVIAMAHAQAGINPETITFIEAHGTGTPLGDPIEIAALAQVFSGLKQRNRCAVGSVKSNIGHLDTAAGIAGLIKTVLALENQTIPASLHFEHPNSKLNLERTPFYISGRTKHWSSTGPRRAGVSSFGIGGTNAHVVVEEAPARESSGPSRPVQVMVFSAPTASGLNALTNLYSNYFGAALQPTIADVAYTSAVGRKAFRHRLAIVCSNLEEAAELLATQPPGRIVTGAPESKHRPVVFLFSGQGTQYPGMTAGLYRDEPVFREALDTCLDLLEKDSRVLLRPALFPPVGTNSRLAETEITQPALFAVEYALAQTLKAWGVEPDYMIGHSIGEYVAAQVAGVFSLESALRLVALRGRLMQSLPKGAMIAVSADATVATELMDSELSLAALNTPTQCVLSGPLSAIERAEVQFARRGVATLRLNTSHAFHSAMMDPILLPFADAVRHARPQPPSKRVVSNVTGNWLTDAEAVDPQYWAAHLRSCVRFAEGLGTILQEPGSVLVEIGAGQTLAGFARQHPGKTAETPVLTSIRQASDPEDDYTQLLSTLARLWVSGVEPDWKAFYSRERRYRVPLPTYPFQRKRYWIDPPSQPGERPSTTTTLSRNPNISEWFYLPSWKSTQAAERSETAKSRKWLVFSDEVVGTKLTESLRQRGDAVRLVRQGDAFDGKSAEGYVLNPDKRAHYDELLDRLHDENSFPGEILYCWSARHTTDTQQALRDSFHSILHLTQALARHNRVSEIRMNLISSGIHAVLADDPIEPAKAALLGLNAVIPQEQPGLRCRNIEITLTEWPAVLESVLEECAAPMTDTVIAFRGGRRWVRDFESVRWTGKAGSGSLLRAGGSYLITGGFGNVGLTLAETLAKHFRARLALLTRTPLPELRDRDDWVRKHGAEERMSRRICAVRELEALGAQVLVIVCDVTNPKEMAAAMEMTRDTYGSVDGVIHAAAEMMNSAFQPISLTDKTNSTLHFAPKISATEILGTLVPKFNPSFCMLISSLSSVLGGLNFSSYAAANCVLDAFAEKQNRTRQRTRWISVNWDGWQFEEDAESRTKLRLTPAEGADVFRRILEHGNTTRVVISTGDLKARIERWINLGTPAVEIPETLAAVHKRPELETKYAKPNTFVEQMVADVWQGVLGIAALGIHDDFFEIGGHSLLAIQVVSRLRELWHADIALTALFEFPTVAQLAKHVEGKLVDAEGRMEDLAKMLDYVEQLSPEEVKALLSDQQGN